MPGSPSLPPRPTLARFSIAVETSAQAQAIQAFLWCLWWIQWARIANLTSTLAAGAVRNEFENFGYDALDRLITHTPILGITDQGTGSNAYDLAGNVTSKAGLALGYASNSNALCNTTASAACTRKTAANAVAGDVVYDGNGNIQSYTRPLTASTPGADGALLNLFEYSSFNMPRLITKSLNGAVVTSGEFFYDAGYQRVRQIKRTGATTFGTGNIADDVLYVVPGGFEVHRNSAGQVTSSIATISGSDGVAATVSTVFDVNTGLPVAQNNIATGNVSTAQSGTDTVTKLILKDHLGSMVAEITLAGTAASPSVNIATLVIHGFGPWGNARGANPFAEGQRGFTGHEHLAELGIIHMNGRLYDPVLGRFLQADPIIQAPHNAQSHNRYVYVLNNPLSFTDPSGFSAWTQWRAPILALAAAITMQYYLMPYLLGASTFAALSTGGKFVAVVAAGFASGGIAGGNIQSALQGAFFAGLTFGLATEFGLHEGAKFLDGKHLGQMALHSAMGCAQSAAAGGSCKSGAVSGGVSAFASPLLPGDGKSFSAGRLIGNAIIGAVASRLSGGKAENGALTAAFSYLFNEASSGSGGPGPSEVGAEGVRQVIDRYREQGYTIVDTEVVASLPGIDSRRRYDFVTVSKDTGGYVGVEVKASSIGIFRLDRQQVNFDTALLSTPSGALALDGGYRITGVRYEGVDITGNINARWQQGFLFRRLQLLGVQPDRTTAPR